MEVEPATAGDSPYKPLSPVITGLIMICDCPGANAPGFTLTPASQAKRLFVQALEAAEAGGVPSFPAAWIPLQY